VVEVVPEVVPEGLPVAEDPPEEEPVDPPAGEDVVVPVLRGEEAELVTVTPPPEPTQLLLELFKTLMGATEVVRFTGRNAYSLWYAQEYCRDPTESRISRVK
jgi:hypothetical protein